MTQDECKSAWLILKSHIREEIRKIDKETPAWPTVEPDWWCEMMDIVRAVSVDTNVFGAKQSK